MIKIIHKKKYENIKKEKFNSVADILFVDECEDYGIVIETSYNYAIVLYDNEFYEVKLAKSIKGVINRIVFPGDKVILNNNEITGIVYRRNILCRDKRDGTKLNDVSTQKVIATNIDIAVIVVAANEPPLHPKFIDRYIVLLKNSNIPFILCINKSDLITEKEERIIRLYESLGIKVIKTSTYTGEGMELLKNTLNQNQAIFVGHSGVGKSSLTNAIIDNINIKTGKVRDKNRRGCHTTTTSIYYKWNDLSSIIDTPGIRSLDISMFDQNDIKNYFDEFVPYNSLCKYKDCLHDTEPNSSCMIKKQVMNGVISKERYDSYVKIIKDIKGR